MGVRSRFNAGVARQLGRPGGLAGRVVAVMLNRRNRRSLAAAVEALSPAPGAVVADIGFGGGLGIELLLDRVGPPGHVHGIEVSTTMLDRAARRFRGEISDGRLILHAGSLTDLPLPNVSLDGAMTVNTIYFIEDLSRAFAELGRVLKPSGHAVVGIADPEWMRAQPAVNHGFRVRPVETVTVVAAEAGLILEDHRRVGEDPHPFHLLVLGRS
jgi:SAM-dependent methyltransferase